MVRKCDLYLVRSFLKLAPDVEERCEFGFCDLSFEFTF